MNGVLIRCCVRTKTCRRKPRAYRGRDWSSRVASEESKLGNKLPKAGRINSPTDSEEVQLQPPEP
jgi:hypothetical protein